MTQSHFDTQFECFAAPAIESMFGVEISLHIQNCDGSTFAGPQDTVTMNARRSRIIDGAVGGDTSIKLEDERYEYWLPVASVDFGLGPMEPKQCWTITEGADVYQIMPLDDYSVAVEKVHNGADWRCQVKKVSG